MKDPQLEFVAVAAVLVLAVVLPLVILVTRRAGAVREMLRQLAAAAGWSEITNLPIRSGVRGVWRSFVVSFAYIPRQKSTPQRLMVNVGARSDVRLSVGRRFSGWLSNRPLAWFGPPLVEVHAPAAAQFWVCADEVNLAERLFADESVAAAIGATLVGRHDSLRVNAKGLRIIRALDDRATIAKYEFPRFTMRFEPERFEALVQEEWNAAEAVVNKLSLM